MPSVTKRLVNLLDDVETPGKLRKVGPSLRHVASKVDFDFLYSWIRKPSDFRPTTKMPQFFGQYDHLDGKGLEESRAVRADRNSRHQPSTCSAKSQPFEYAAPAQGGHGRAFGRARQAGLRGPLPGLPSAQRFPRRQDGRRVPTCRGSAPS